MSERTDLPAWVKPDIWLDDDHCVEFTTLHGDTEPCGGIMWHRKKAASEFDATPGWCPGGFYWRDVPGKLPPGPRWDLVSREPLTISPSLLCSCGEHGFIRDGRWIPA